MKIKYERKYLQTTYLTKNQYLKYISNSKFSSKQKVTENGQMTLKRHHRRGKRDSKSAQLIINNQGNTNYDYNEILLYAHQMDKKISTISNSDEDNKKLGYSYIAKSNIKPHSHSGKFGSSSKRLNMQLLYDSATELLDVYLRK